VEIVLKRNRFGHPGLETYPADGILGASHHNVDGSTPTKRKYRVGTVLKAWHPGNTASSVAGYTEFVYGIFDQNNGTKLDPDPNVIVIPTAIDDLFTFTDDVNDCASLAAAAFAVVMLGAIATNGTPIATGLMTDTYYGWFWSGGVYPTDFVTYSVSGSESGFTGTSTFITAVDTIVAGSSVYVVGQAASAEGFALSLNPQDASVVSVGMALAADD